LLLHIQLTVISSCDCYFFPATQDISAVFEPICIRKNVTACSLQLEACSLPSTRFMEIFRPRIPALLPAQFQNLPTPGIKSKLMNSRTLLNRMIILGFMVLVGYCLARSIYYQSVIGTVLAIVSLGSGLYFLNLLAKANQQTEKEF